uniref:Large ribosomal subunit protein uL23c n=1 Tax=Platysiphonia delicata TaxID=2006979 RepID=A0A1Z1M0N8_9FLOR|nr:ribosomal protein L23 [Platysiphonia delicata]ARW59629.1 ribosomal protein L23 [Platysiphonia delicata]
MKSNNSKQELLNLVKYPIITDKTTKEIENNKYTFAVTRQSNKNKIKQAVEYIFDVKVKKVNTTTQVSKKKRVGKFIGNVTKYKKAIIELHENYSINLLEDNQTSL